MANKRKPIRLFVSDLDGTITNGLMTFDHCGNVSKSYHTRDVSAFWILQYENDVDVLILTGSAHSCDLHRFRWLEMDPKNKENKRPVETFIIQSAGNKVETLQKYMDKYGYDWDEVSFIGDAENDYELLRHVSFSACPKDALDYVREACMFVSHYPAGNGAVREFAESVIRLNDSIREELLKKKPNKKK